MTQTEIIAISRFSIESPEYRQISKTFNGKAIKPEPLGLFINTKTRKSKSVEREKIYSKTANRAKIPSYVKEYAMTSQFLS